MPDTSLPGWAVAAGGVLVSVVVGLVGALLRRAIGDLDSRFTGLSMQIAQLSERLEERGRVTGEHAVSLAGLAKDVESLERRVARLEGGS